jgi:hypothetical protein
MAYGEADMRKSGRREKEIFIRQKRISFIDLISEVEAERGKESNFADRYIARRVKQWTDVIQDADKLRFLKRVCVTRKSFSDVRTIGERIGALAEYFERRGVHFQCLISPARFYSIEKQAEWNSFLSA